MQERTGALVSNSAVCVDFTISGLENGQETVSAFFAVFPKNSLMSSMPAGLGEVMLILSFLRDASVMGGGKCNGWESGIGRVKVRF